MRGNRQLSTKKIKRRVKNYKTFVVKSETHERRTNDNLKSLKQSLKSFQKALLPKFIQLAEKHNLLNRGYASLGDFIKLSRNYLTEFGKLDENKSEFLQNLEQIGENIDLLTLYK